jgi:hypothetical protein
MNYGDEDRHQIAIADIQIMTEKQNEDQGNAWERGKLIANWISAIAIPLVLGVIGYVVNLTLQSRESQGKMVELAIGILKTEPTNSDDNRQIRAWAVDVIEKYSGVPISKNTRRVFEENPLPSEGRLKAFGIRQEDLGTISRDKLKEIARADDLREELVNKADPTSRTSVRVLYKPNGVDVERISRILRNELAYDLEIQQSTERKKEITNAIWFGRDVPIDDVKIIAYTLIRAGVPLKSIRPFRSDLPSIGELAHTIHIGTDFDLENRKPLTTSQVHGAESFTR